MRGVVTYQVGEGQMITVDAQSVEEVGIGVILAEHGYDLPTERVPVYQRDRKVGSIPAMFDPLNIRSASFFYEPRRGDFKREADKWVAARNLGPGDLDAIEGFIWDRSEPDEAPGQMKLAAYAFCRELSGGCACSFIDLDPCETILELIENGATPADEIARMNREREETDDES